MTLYTSQRCQVAEQIETDGVYFVKSRFIREKYGEVAHLFLFVYEWYKMAASQYLRRPDEAESGIWAFFSPMDVSPYEDSTILTLRVPVEEAVYFDMLEWSDLLNFRFLGSAKAQSDFYAKLKKQGIADPMQIVTTSFYPLLKQELMASWNFLFRHHESVKNGESVPVSHLQAGLWQIRKEWVIDAK